MRAIAYRAGVVLVVVALGTSACHRTSPTAPVDDRVDGRWTGTMRDRWAGTVRVELPANARFFPGPVVLRRSGAVETPPGLRLIEAPVDLLPAGEALNGRASLRFAIDPATGLVWESEHGPSGGDEVNIIEPGSNYGWGVVSKGLQPGIKEVSAPGMVDPVAWYNPTIAPSGIAFYEGDRYAGWKGSLLLCGLRGQQLRRLTVKGREVVSEEVLFSGLGRVRAIATGPDGLLYVLMTDPTGPGSSVNFTDPVRGSLVRLDPITWKQVEFRFQ